jgi:hypothetical protein
VPGTGEPAVAALDVELDRLYAPHKPSSASRPTAGPMALPRRTTAPRRHLVFSIPPTAVPQQASSGAASLPLRSRT